MDKVPVTTLNIARIFYLWNLLRMPTFNPKSLKKLDAIEAIIQLNALCRGFGLNVDEIEQHIDKDVLWRYLHNVSLKFPLGLQVDYLIRIGFDLNEITSLILSEKPIRFSSKTLNFTDVEYVPLMSEELSKIKKNKPNINSIDAMNLLTSTNFNLSEQKSAKIE